VALGIKAVPEGYRTYFTQALPLIAKLTRAYAEDRIEERLKHGFVYLVAVMDLYSRYIVSWRISNTLETDFCCKALKEALSRGTPEYFNTDQGAQFTAE